MAPAEPLSSAHLHLPPLHIVGYAVCCISDMRVGSTRLSEESLYNSPQ